MKPRHLFSFILLSLCLAHCAHSVKPYSDKREASRATAHEMVQTDEQFAFADGRQAGQRDVALGDRDSYRRHSPMYTPATENAYADGYHEGYGGTTAAPVRDEGYQQGFDYGMRDRAGRKASDPDAHIGEYDPRLRASFERGYVDGFNK